MGQASSKALGNGMPISATMIRSDLVTDEFKTDESCCFTYRRSPLPCVAASATIDILFEEKLPERATSLGKKIMKRLEEMNQKHPLIGDIRGKGLFSGIELVKDRTTKEPASDEAEQINATTKEKGVFFNLNHRARYGNMILMKPALTITEGEIDQALDILEEKLGEVE